MNRNLRKAITFIGVVFFVNYLLAILYFALGGQWVMPGSLIVATAYMFIPMTVALILQKLVYKEPIKKPLGISFKLNRWFLVAWLLPPTIAFATIGVSLLFPGVEYSPSMAGMFERYSGLFTPSEMEEMQNQISAFPIHPIWIGLVQGLLAGVTVNAVAGFGEELGWRGFLQKEFSFMGFWKSSVVIGLVWGVWHAPLILQGHNYPENPVAGVFMMVIFTLLLSPIISYIRLKANSVIAAAVTHGSINGTLGLSILVIDGGNDLTVGVTGISGFIVLFAAVMGIFIYDRKFAKESIM
jgi:membrane protease YdiL (CAAX protease family)